MPSPDHRLDRHQQNGVPRAIAQHRFEPIDIPRKDLPRRALAGAMVLLAIAVCILAATVIVVRGHA